MCMGNAFFICFQQVFEGFSEEQEAGLKRNGLDWMLTEEEVILETWFFCFKDI